MSEKLFLWWSVLFQVFWSSYVKKFSYTMQLCVVKMLEWNILLWQRGAQLLLPKYQMSSWQQSYFCNLVNLCCWLASFVVIFIAYCFYSLLFNVFCAVIRGSLVRKHYMHNLKQSNLVNTKSKKRPSWKISEVKVLFIMPLLICGISILLLNVFSFVTLL